MAVRKPHFLLFCDSSPSQSHASDASERCNWRCVLDNLENQDRIEIQDSDPELNTERGSLMAVVRGLEALEQPSSVTLVTSSSYVSKGMRYGLREWRENDYKCDHFGRRIDVRNDDLWRRIDTAMKFHEVDCRLIGSAHNAAVVVSETNDASTASSIRAPHFQNVVRSSSRLTNLLGWRHITRVAVNMVRRVPSMFAQTLRIILQLPERTVFGLEAAFDAFCRSFAHSTRQHFGDPHNRIPGGMY